MSDHKGRIADALNHAFPQPSYLPDWNNVLARAKPRAHQRARIVAVLAGALVAVVVPTLAFSQSVRQLFGLTAPAPVLNQARLRLSVPGGPNVVRLWTAPSTKGGQCEFVQIAPRNSKATANSNGGGSCSPAARSQPRRLGITWTLTSLLRGSRRAVLNGFVLSRRRVAGVDLHWATGRSRLAYKDGYFLAVLTIYNPPKSRLPYEIVASDEKGREVAKSRIYKGALYLQWANSNK